MDKTGEFEREGNLRTDRQGDEVNGLRSREEGGGTATRDEEKLRVTTSEEATGGGRFHGDETGQDDGTTVGRPVRHNDTTTTTGRTDRGKNAVSDAMDPTTSRRATRGCGWT